MPRSCCLWQRCLATTLLRLPIRGGNDKPRCPHGNIMNEPEFQRIAYQLAQSQRGRRRAPASTSAAQPGAHIRRGQQRVPASMAAAQPGAHILRGHHPHARAAAAQQGRTSHPPSPSQNQKSSLPPSSANGPTSMT
jgi:hypothetical protein